MTKRFTASDGVTLVEPDNTGGYRVGRDGRSWACIAEEWAGALREFFLHEAGIWVDPETEGLVFRNPGMDDKDGRCVTIRYGDNDYTAWERVPCGHGVVDAIAERYFATHPLPKPWHDAQPDQVWSAVLDSTGGVRPLTVMEYQEEGLVFFDAFREDIYELTDPCITYAQQIWPEVVTNA